MNRFPFLLLVLSVSAFAMVTGRLPSVISIPKRDADRIVYVGLAKSGMPSDARQIGVLVAMDAANRHFDESLRETGQPLGAETLRDYRNQIFAEYLRMAKDLESSPVASLMGIDFLRVGVEAVALVEIRLGGRVASRVVGQVSRDIFGPSTQALESVLVEADRLGAFSPDFRASDRASSAQLTGVVAGESAKENLTRAGLLSELLGSVDPVSGDMKVKLEYLTAQFRREMHATGKALPLISGLFGFADPKAGAAVDAVGRASFQIRAVADSLHDQDSMSVADGVAELAHAVSDLLSAPLGGSSLDAMLLEQVKELRPRLTELGRDLRARLVLIDGGTSSLLDSLIDALETLENRLAGKADKAAVEQAARQVSTQLLASGIFAGANSERDVQLESCLAVGPEMSTARFLECLEALRAATVKSSASFSGPLEQVFLDGAERWAKQVGQYFELVDQHLDLVRQVPDNVERLHQALQSQGGTLSESLRLPGPEPTALAALVKNYETEMRRVSDAEASGEVGDTAAAEQANERLKVFLLLALPESMASHDELRSYFFGDKFSVDTTQLGPLAKELMAKRGRRERHAFLVQSQNRLSLLERVRTLAVPSGSLTSALDELQQRVEEIQTK